MASQWTYPISGHFCWCTSAIRLQSCICCTNIWIPSTARRGLFDVGHHISYLPLWERLSNVGRLCRPARPLILWAVWLLVSVGHCTLPKVEIYIWHPGEPPAKMKLTSSYNYSSDLVRYIGLNPPCIALLLYTPRHHVVSHTTGSRRGGCYCHSKRH